MLNELPGVIELGIFAAVPSAIVIYVLGLVASFKFSIWFFDKPQDFQDYQLLVIFVMGVCAAVSVKIFSRFKFESPHFGNIALMLIGVILGISAIFSYARGLNMMEYGLPYLETFTILSATALIFGTR